ncbi:hypothetical protein CHA01nite_03320 [Chryseobacterium hagamense]|uniref:Uncharacterized protein n=1 Tax=Chryseobacterium hagamense TaxID=395935 RepID=A0A511YHA8_9FLAO|nr:hypothetical protein CHA01nite_03320 [Chryseobacterium hagamense]
MNRKYPTTTIRKEDGAFWIDIENLYPYIPGIILPGFFMPEQRKDINYDKRNNTLRREEIGSVKF